MTMLARCAHCQQTFTTERFGVQTCPHCGQQVHLADPGSPGSPTASPPAADRGAPTPPAAPPAADAQGGAAPPADAAQGWSAPPPPYAAPGWSPFPPAPPPGWPPPPGAPGSGWPAPPHPGAPPVPGERSAPFALRRQLGFARSFVETWKLAALRPSDFFRWVKVDEAGTAVLFGLVAITVMQWFQGVYGLVAGEMWHQAFDEVLRRLPEDAAVDREALRRFATGGAGFVAQVVIAPLYALVSIYLTAGVVHLFLVLFGAARRGFDATLTTVGYASGLYLVGVVPACGAPVAAGWFLVALIVGLGESQRCGTGRAAAATLLPGLLLACLCCAGGASLTAAIVGTGMAAPRP